MTDTRSDAAVPRGNGMGMGIVGDVQKHSRLPRMFSDKLGGMEMLQMVQVYTSKC